MDEIITPLELDAAGRALDRDLQRTSRSPRQQAHRIIKFIRDTERIPGAWTVSYYLPLLHRLLLLVRHPYINDCDPAFWRSCAGFLYRPEIADAVAAVPDGAAALESMWIRASRDHAQAGALRELHGLLTKCGRTSVELTERQWSSVFSSGASEFVRFTAYMKEVSEDEALSGLLEIARHSWHEFRTRKHGATVVLLELDPVIPEASGVVSTLSIRIERTHSPGFHFAGAIGQEGGVTHQQLALAHRTALNIAARRIGARKNYSMRCGFDDACPMYAGASLGLASAVGAVAAISCDHNGPVCWLCPSTTAMIGSIDENENVRPGSWSSIEQKLRTCFFSPVEHVIVPAAHRERGQKLLAALQAEYPERALSLHGVSTIDDCFKYSGALGEQRRSKMQRTAEVLRTHPAASLAVLLLLVASIAAYFAYRAYYGYPNLEKALGIRILTNSIVYNPKDSLEWCFRDDTSVVRPEVPFGDLEKGDGFSRNFWIWNLTPVDRKVLLSIEGPDSSDWYINWNGGLQTLPSTKALRMSVMFAPLSEGAGKRAALVLREPDSHEELHRISFSGAAGPHTPGGYALRLDGIDDMLEFGQSCSEFDTPELTLECWIKMLSEKKGTFLHDGSNHPDKPAFHNREITFFKHNIWLRLGPFRKSIDLPAVAHLEPHVWRHFALSYSIPRSRISLYIDGRAILDTATEFLMDRSSEPHLTIGAFNDLRERHGFLEAEIDEMRLWKTYLPADSIVMRMRKRPSPVQAGITGYWTFDSDCEVTSFNANKRGHGPVLSGRPSLVRSTAPLQAEPIGYRTVPGPAGKPAVELPPRCYLFYPLNPFPRYTEATYSIRHRNDKEGFRVILSTMNLDRSVDFSRDTLYAFRSTNPYKPPDTGWHHWCLRYASRMLELFVDGKPVIGLPYEASKIDRWHRYEGITVGFVNDKYNALNLLYYDWARKRLSSSCAVSDLAIWQRALTDAEIARLVRGSPPPPSGLILHAPLEAPKNGAKSFPLAVGKGSMHLRLLKGWE